MTVTIYTGQELAESHIKEIEELFPGFNREVLPNYPIRDVSKALRTCAFVGVSIDDSTQKVDGFGTAHIHRQRQNGEIGIVYVHPAARNLGKGKELLQALDQRISENPTIKNIFFQTENKRMGLIGLNNGYEHVPEEYCFIRRIKE